MVAVRSAHLNPTGEFAVDDWVASLGITNPQSSEQLADTWRYCEQRCKNHPDFPLLLWRGIEMVEILSMLSMDNDSLCAALLFPLADANVVEETVLEAEFGKSILDLVQGVRDMDAIRQLKAIYNDSMAPEQMDNIRRMLLAIVEDFRCVVIKLAERIAHLRELKDAPEDERVLAAKESTNIYAPLANRLGIGQLKWELEDFCFRYLHPEEYKHIAKLLHERRIDREQYIEDFVIFLRKAVQKEGLKADIYGRPKHIYSIWRKMQKKTLEFDELFDVRAVRVVVEHLQDCYAALSIVHTHFHYLPDEFDDYVANPKPNGYQSIHTVILGPHGKTLEIQIRTRHMHEDAELGVAAHWKYKEGSTTLTGGKSGYEQRITWLRKLLAWQEEMTDSSEMRDEVRSQVFDDRIYVFTPKGSISNLPARSTPLNFVYHIHSDVDHCYIGAKIKDRIVSLFTYQLHMGDQVETITQKHLNTSCNWLNPNLWYVTTSRKHSKIHNWFRKQDRYKNIFAGHQLSKEELEYLDISMREAGKLLLTYYNVNTLDELLISLSSGDICINKIVNYLRSKMNKSSTEDKDKQTLHQLTQKTMPLPRNRDNGRVIVGDVSNLMYQITRCFRPIPANDISAFITQGRGISIHCADCEQLADLQTNVLECIVDTVWCESYFSGRSLVVRVTTNDRSSLLHDIITFLVNEKVNVLSIASHSDIKKIQPPLIMDIEIYNQQVLEQMLLKFNQLPNVIDVRRLHDN